MSKHHPASRRTPSHREENPDDLFIAKVIQLSNWAQSHRQALIAIGVVAAVAIAGGLYWSTYRTSLTEQATQELVEIQQLRAFGDPAQAKADLQVFLERFSGTPSAAEGRLLLGQLHLETGDPEAAVTALEPLSGRRTPLGIQATFLLAAAHEEAGNPQEAERLYLTVANRADMSFIVRDALTQAARIRFNREDYGGAVQLYEEILTYFEETDPERGLIEMRLAEARAMG